MYRDPAQYVVQFC